MWTLPGTSLSPSLLHSRADSQHSLTSFTQALPLMKFLHTASQSNVGFLEDPYWHRVTQLASDRARIWTCPDSTSIHPTPQARALNHYLRPFFLPWPLIFSTPLVQSNQKSPSEPKNEPGAAGRVSDPKARHDAHTWMPNSLHGDQESTWSPRKGNTGDWRGDICLWCSFLKALRDSQPLPQGYREAKATQYESEHWTENLGVHPAYPTEMHQQTGWVTQGSVVHEVFSCLPSSHLILRYNHYKCKDF